MGMACRNQRRHILSMERGRVWFGTPTSAAPGAAHTYPPTHSSTLHIPTRPPSPDPTPAHTPTHPPTYAHTQHPHQSTQQKETHTLSHPPTHPPTHLTPPHPSPTSPPPTHPLTHILSTHTNPLHEKGPYLVTYSQMPMQPLPSYPSHSPTHRVPHVLTHGTRDTLAMGRDGVWFVSPFGGTRCGTYPSAAWCSAISASDA